MPCFKDLVPISMIWRGGGTFKGWGPVGGHWRYALERESETQAPSLPVFSLLGHEVSGFALPKAPCHDVLPHQRLKINSAN
jgi:hypothetical protein